MKRGKWYAPPASGPYGYPRGNRVMSAKRTSGPSPNTEMLTRMREQEMRLGGTSVYNPRTGKRRVLDHTGGLFVDPAALVVTIVDDFYH